MSHDYHEGLVGYSPNQILHDGCGECEQRAHLYDRGISSLDPSAFRRAVERAEAMEHLGLSDASDAELPLLHVLASVHRQQQIAQVLS